MIRLALVIIVLVSLTTVGSVQNSTYQLPLSSETGTVYAQQSLTANSLTPSTLGLASLEIPQTSTDDSIAAKADGYIKQQAGIGFSGAVLLARGGHIVIERAYNEPATLGAHPAFWLASNSKQFVAAAVLRLQEQGKLSVSDPITRFLKNVPTDKEKVTLHHLLTHTSGLPHRYVADGIVNREEAVQAILALPLEGSIGQRYHYSNDGYNLLAAIVEVASGKSFEEYLRTELFDPAGMKHTGFWGYQDDAPIVPIANTAQLRNQKPTIFRDGKGVANWGYRGATGVFSTTEDLYLWLQALSNGTVLNKSSVEQMWSAQVFNRHGSQKGREIYYGYGWGVITQDGRRVGVNHAGDEDWLGHNGVIARHENGDVIIVLSNAGQIEDDSWSVHLSRRLSEILSQ
jgi:CubicO group peptidase (beta-lactamase class C family)